jgi:putative transposase
MARPRKRHIQLDIEFRTHGGFRKGAGRKRTSARPRVPHCPRPEITRSTPAHITLRVLDDVGRLRRRDAFKIVRGVMIEHLGREDTRVIDLSIQGNHIHLVCEANSRQALSAEMHDFKIAVARRINRIRNRKGAVFADRYHEEILRSPTQTRRCLAYVLNNWRRHGEDRFSSKVVDPFSTAMWFEGWREASGVDVPTWVECLPRREPQSWLLREGWLRGGSKISFFEVPGPR